MLSSFVLLSIVSLCSHKVGEHHTGDVIQVVQESVNGKGLRVVQTITPPKGASKGGWMKVRLTACCLLLAACCLLLAACRSQIVNSFNLLICNNLLSRLQVESGKGKVLMKQLTHGEGTVRIRARKIGRSCGNILAIFWQYSGSSF